MLSAHRLRILRAVIDAGSVRAAAEQLTYAPATVSQHLHALATETGLVLFARHGRGIVPTAAARELAASARGLIEELGRLDRTVADLRQGRAEHLAVACFSSAAEAWMPHVALALRATHPLLTVEVSLNEPYDGRGRRTPDLDIRNEPVDASPQHLEGHDRHELLVERCLAVLPRSHPLAAESSLELHRLRDESWVDHDIYDSPTGRIIADACETAGFAPRYVARLDDHHAALAMVAAGLGIAVLPRLALAGLPPALVARDIRSPGLLRRVVAHVRRRPGDEGVTAAAMAVLHERARLEAGSP